MNKSYGVYMAKSTETVDHVMGVLIQLTERIGCRPHLGFCDWDNDPRELYDIPEVQKWCREFIQKGGLSLVDRMEDVVPGVDLPTNLPTQMLLVACAGMPGAERKGGKLFHYDLDQIAALEQQYRS